MLIGGGLIAAGHFSLAVPAPVTFYLGLVLIVCGTGLLKPNISVIVGQLYAKEDIRRDAAFSLFYMGINLGAFIGPLITGYLAQDEGFRARLTGWGLDPNSAWHWGSARPASSMTLGPFSKCSAAASRCRRQSQNVPQPRKRPEAPQQAKRGSALPTRHRVALGAAAATGMPLTIDQVVGARHILLAVVLAFFGWLFFAGSWTPVGRNTSTSSA